MTTRAELLRVLDEARAPAGSIVDRVATLVQERTAAESERRAAVAARDEAELRLYKVVDEVIALRLRVAELTAALETERRDAVVRLCLRCGGKGRISIACSMCHDSTWDHECDDHDVECSACRGTASAGARS